METSTPLMVYQLRVELLDSDPPIWRSVWIHPTTSLGELHRLLVATMGWSGQAEYSFSRPGPPPRQNLAPPTRLQTLLLESGDSLLYTYDPVQGWLHRLVLESSSLADPALKLPYCANGERQTPPEFCAGVWGYEDLLDRLSDPEDPDYDQLWAQVGYDFDPERFDAAVVNQRLAALPS
ncbi:MAG TPA: plasmid pRiA4b ORF-3 family protein [Leptolyngbyaceae cyanobacterium M65_K2018_010]|nr:plasmid pRiA4b ORF-3 family protein [Leptolyngbyaceae cyanobacterium M65_K2018_010]